MSLEPKLTLVGGTVGVPPDKSVTYLLGAYRGEVLVAIKIGKATRGRVTRRLRTLQTGCVDKLRILAVFDGGNLERELHRRFAKHRVAGEFFAPAEVLNWLNTRETPTTE